MTGGDDLLFAVAPLVAAAGRDPAGVLAVEMLSGGISGAATYRVTFADGALVCKLTRAGCVDHVWQRALRERRFYQRLRTRQPLRTPRLLASVSDERGLGLALAAYHTPLPARQWTRRRLLTVADQLGRLHAAHWNDDGALAKERWLRRHTHASSADERERGAEAWRALADDASLPPARLAPILRLLDRSDALEQTIAAYPLTVIHGDCHAGNTLRDGAGHLIWADWQEVGVGPGPADLVFFEERARFDGASVPADFMLARYHRALETCLRRPLESAAVRRAVVALETRDWLLAWPAYLGGVPAERMAVVVVRLTELAEGWENKG